MEVTLNRHVEITPGVRGGKPRIAETRITVADVAIVYLRMGQSLEEIAGKYQLSLASVHAAIERQIQDDEAFVAAFMENNPSRLQEKFKVLSAQSCGHCPPY